MLYKHEIENKINIETMWKIIECISTTKETIDKKIKE